MRTNLDLTTAGKSRKSTWSRLRTGACKSLALIGSTSLWKSSASSMICRSILKEETKRQRTDCWPALSNQVSRRSTHRKEQMTSFKSRMGRK